MAYTGRQVPERIPISNRVNMDILKKAVWLSNNIFQLERALYREQLLVNAHGEVLYYFPVSSETILSMDARFAKACSIVYTAIRMEDNLSADDMIELNEIYKIIREEYGS